MKTILQNLRNRVDFYGLIKHTQISQISFEHNFKFKVSIR